MLVTTDPPMTRAQRDLLRKQIDARMRERLSTMAQKGARPRGHVSKAKRPVKSS